MEEKNWNQWIGRLEKVRDAGLRETKNPFDRERYEALDALIDEIKSTLPEDFKKLPALFDSLLYAPTPKAGVRTAVIAGERILLVKEGEDGRWVLPGGWADIYCSPAENAVKECLEEAGIDCTPQKIVSVFSGSGAGPGRSPIVRITFLARPERIEEWQFQENLETVGAKFFDRYHLPPLFTGKTSKEIIELCFDSYHDERMPTLFEEIYESL